VTSILPSPQTKMNHHGATCDDPYRHAPASLNALSPSLYHPLHRRCAVVERQRLQYRPTQCSTTRRATTRQWYSTSRQTMSTHRRISVVLLLPLHRCDVRPRDVLLRRHGIRHHDELCRRIVGYPLSSSSPFIARNDAKPNHDGSIVGSVISEEDRHCLPPLVLIGT
jgi:hypothetical protein